MSVGIYLTASQCCFPGLLMNQLTTPTACAMSGLVHTIAYIKLPIAEAYGTLLIWSLSSSVFGDCSLLSLKLLSKGVLTGLASFMLNLLRTFFTYSDFNRR
ncbi:hypothetical protein RGQ29_002779 [Quercus rubra]|uniref:Uncharacterized protein n=1 Tax=Quercus rubra TaxID=3512 RepID=A0AAN7EAL8_QUERU|nr:hypothetical protein RGQ29_002779 [Quercus rubra]